MCSISSFDQSKRILIFKYRLTTMYVRVTPFSVDLLENLLLFIYCLVQNNTVLLCRKCFLTTSRKKIGTIINNQMYNKKNVKYIIGL
jgi:hypothetical protein